MTEAQKGRFSLLQNEWCGFQFIHELYGVDLSRENRFLRHFRAWAEQRGRAEAVRGEREIHRYRFETFLQTQKLLPKKWGAIRLGMKVESLDQVLAKMSDLGLVFAYYPSEEPNQFVGEKLDHDLLEVFDDFRFRTFSDHNDFCHRLHQAIEQKYGITIRPEFDVTTQFLSNDQRHWDYAHDWDAINIAPVSLQFQVWLDLGKPMNLRPDCCSTLFYVHERELLKDYVVGTSEPYIPSELIAAVSRKKAAG